MDSLRISKSCSFLQRLSTSALLFIASMITSLVFFTHPIQAYITVNDTFYLPDINCQITIDGIRSETAWQANNRNWFTFGSEGYFQVKVFGFYHDDSLYLAFRLEDNTYSTEDRLYICIDPNNTGDPADENNGGEEEEEENEDEWGERYNNNSLKRYTIKRNGNTTYSFRDTTINQYRLMIPQPSNTEIECDIEEGLENSFWEIEIKINQNYVGINNIENFGLYFQVVDFHSESNDYREYWWPISAHADTFAYNKVPFAIEWANGQCLVPSGTNAPRPDIFFDENDVIFLRTGNRDNLTIICNENNNIFTKVNNGFLHGSSVNAIPLQFRYAKFGAGCFEPIDEIASSMVLPNQAIEASVFNWRPTCSETKPMKVTLRVEHIYLDDAITSNNVMINNMEFREVAGGDSFSVPVTITNCTSEIQQVALRNNTGNAGLDVSMELNYPEMLPPSEMRPDFFYIYIDRAALDMKKGMEENWEIGFDSMVKGDTFFPKKDSEIKNLYLLKLKPGSSTTFLMGVIVPSSASKHVSLWELFLEIFRSKQSRSIYDAYSTSQIQTKTIPASVSDTLTTTPTVIKPLPRGRVFKIKLDVLKVKKTYNVDGRTYRLMKHLGTFGSIVLVKSKPLATVWKIIISLIVLILFAIIIYLLWLWKRSKWDLWKYIVSVIIIILVIIIFLLIKICFFTS